MSEQQTKGLFLVQGLRLEHEIVAQAYCRIVSVELMSAQPPQQNRLLVYKVGYWDHQPNPEDEYKVFQCPISGMDTFARRLPTDALDEDAIIKYAIDHFMALVLPRKSIRDAKLAIEQLYSINKAPWPTSSVDDSLLFSVYDVQHHRVFRADEGKDLAEAYSVVTYRVMITKDDNHPDVDFGAVKWDELNRLQFNAIWTDPTAMVEQAIAHFSQPDTQAAVYNAILTKNG